jgi:hypothetical protein
VLAVGELELFGGALGADADHRGLKTVEFRKGVTVRAALRGAAAGPRNVVPAEWQRLSGATGARVEVRDQAAGCELGEIADGTVGRGQGQRRDPHAWKVVGGTVVLRHREVAGERGVVGFHGQILPAPPGAMELSFA